MVCKMTQNMESSKDMGHVMSVAALAGGGVGLQ